MPVLSLLENRAPNQASKVMEEFGEKNTNDE